MWAIHAVQVRIKKGRNKFGFLRMELETERFGFAVGFVPHLRSKEVRGVCSETEGATLPLLPER